MMMIVKTLSVEMIENGVSLLHFGDFFTYMPTSHMKGTLPPHPGKASHSEREGEARGRYDAAFS